MIFRSKYKICKRLGAGVFEKCQTQKFTLAEARSARSKVRGKRPSPRSDYAIAQREKQRVRFSLGLSERQFSRYIRESIAQRKGSPVEHLMRSFESRLDSVVFRFGLANTRGFARQVVSHGHITVNGKRITIPSYIVREGDRVAVRDGSKTKGLFEGLNERMKEYTLPRWLTFDTAKKEGVVTSRPNGDPAALGFNLESVIEFYRR